MIYNRKADMIPWNRLLVVFAASFFFLQSLSAQYSLAISAMPGAFSDSPKREFRGAWIATVTNLDWPSTRSSTAVQQQRNELTALLDQLVAAGINAVIFQVRPECDALYNSPFEPWSYWLTGSQGTGPVDGYDPLTFAIQESRKRGLELHAWFNPYRAFRETNTYTAANNHVTVQHPDWIITCPDKYKFLDPGLPQVRNFVTQVVMDVVRRYDVDGIHFDDYFYPYSEHNFTTQDAATFTAYPRGFTSNQLAFWRRDNVNLLLKQIYDSIQVAKPVIKFGMSPFGIWKSGTPPGTGGTSAYDVLYCDAVAWLTGKYIDYITPQLYWTFGGSTDYGLLQPWWGSQRNGRHFYTGNATYRIGTSGYPASELANQIKYNRANPEVQGSIQFRANSIRDNLGGWTDLLKSDIFHAPAIVPVMNWKDSIVPNAPQNLRVVAAGGGLSGLEWDPPTAASDGDTATRYVVYRFATQSPQSADRQQSRNMIAIAGRRSVVPSGRIDTTGAQYSFAVAALDRNNNESVGMTGLVNIPTPVAAPLLATPVDSEQYFSRGAKIVWKKVDAALTYNLQVGTASDFGSSTLLTTLSTTDSACLIDGLLAQQTYYWRVVAGGQGASSAYSATRSFKTGWPLPPTLISPVAVSGITRMPTFTWSRSTGTSFEIKITDNLVPVTVILDTMVTDTTYTSSRLLAAQMIYRWYVKASNAYGASEWSAEGRFRTEAGTSVLAAEGIPTEFSLSQNYPNPFNPSTTIRFAIPRVGATTLKVYDLLGREAATLVRDVLMPGVYSVVLDADRLPSGTYFYVLSSDGTRLSKKMILVR